MTLALPVVYRQSYSAYNRLTSHAHRLARSSQPTLAVAREPSFKEDRASLKRATRLPMPSLLTNSATNSARPPIYADSAPPSSMVRRSSGVVSAGSSSGTLPSESHSFPCNEEAEGACAPPKSFTSGKSMFQTAARFAASACPSGDRATHSAASPPVV